jgi:hypothetical protein
MLSGMITDQSVVVAVVYQDTSLVCELKPCEKGRAICFSTSSRHMARSRHSSTTKLENGATEYMYLQLAKNHTTACIYLHQMYL